MDCKTKTGFMDRSCVSIFLDCMVQVYDNMRLEGPLSSGIISMVQQTRDVWRAS